MAPLTQWTWVWVNSGSWWWTGRPGLLQSMESQGVRHNWATELNWTELKSTRKVQRKCLYSSDEQSRLWLLKEPNSFWSLREHLQLRQSRIRKRLHFLWSFHTQEQYLTLEFNYFHLCCTWTFKILCELYFLARNLILGGSLYSGIGNFIIGWSFPMSNIR